MKEQWKEIKGYEGIYEISNLGNVKSLKRIVKGRWGNTKISSKILVPAKDKDGYSVVALCKNGGQKVSKIHRLVAEAFIPNPNNFIQINHKDENKTNNNVSNLEWCNAKYNSNYGTRTNRIKEKTSKKVIQYEKNGEVVAFYDSVNQAKRTTKISHIYDCCNGKLKQVGGYIWRYANER